MKYFGLGLIACLLALAPSLHAQQPDTLLPPQWDDMLLYYRNFDGPAYVDGSLEETSSSKPGPAVVEKGFLGKSAVLDDPYELVVTGDRLNPTRPYTVSFWWAMRADAPIAGAIQWVALQAGGNSRVHFYSRGKGKWCALTEPALVLQVVGLAKTKLATLMARGCQRWFPLKADLWRHTALVFRNSRTVELYLDGRLWRAVTLTGVGFVDSSNFRTLVFGPLFKGNQAILVDEISVLNAALEPAAIEDYYKSMKALHDGPKK